MDLALGLQGLKKGFVRDFAVDRHGDLTRKQFAQAGEESVQFTDQGPDVPGLDFELKLPARLLGYGFRSAYL